MKKQLLYLTILRLSAFSIASTFAANEPQLNLGQREQYVDALIEKLYIETFLHTSKQYRRSFRSVLEDVQPEKKAWRSENNYNIRTKDLKYILKRLQSGTSNDMRNLEHYFTKNIGASSRFGSDFQYPNYKASPLKNGFYTFIATEMPDFFKDVTLAALHREMQMSTEPSEEKQISTELSEKNTQKWRTAAQVVATAGAVGITLKKLDGTLKVLKTIKQINDVYSGNIASIIQQTQQAIPDSWSTKYLPYIQIQTTKMSNILLSWQKTLNDAAKSSPQYAHIINDATHRLFAPTPSSLPQLVREAASHVHPEHAVAGSFRTWLDRIMEKITTIKGVKTTVTPQQTELGKLIASASAALHGIYNQLGNLVKHAGSASEAKDVQALRLTINNTQNALVTTQDALTNGTPSEIMQDAIALAQTGEAVSMAAVQAAMESHGWAGALTPFLEQLATTIGEMAAEATTQAAQGGFEWVPLGEVAF